MYSLWNELFFMKLSVLILQSLALTEKRLFKCINIVHCTHFMNTLFCSVSVRCFTEKWVKSLICMAFELALLKLICIPLEEQVIRSLDQGRHKCRLDNLYWQSNNGIYSKMEIWWSANDCEQAQLWIILTCLLFRASILCSFPEPNFNLGS